MALGIYKQGQGYWVRVLTAVAIGIMILAGAQWAWNQASTVKLPPRSWTFSLINTELAEGNQVNPGDTVVLMGYEGLSNELSETGQATIESFTADRGSSATIVIANFDSEKTRDFAGDAQRIRVGDLGSPTLTASVRSAASTPIFAIQYLQTGAAGLVLLLGAIGLFWFVGSNRRTVDFLVATDGEMKKVNWSSYREVKGSTIVVIVATFLIAGLLYTVDMAFSWFFGAIGVLER